MSKITNIFALMLAQIGLRLLLRLRSGCSSDRLQKHPERSRRALLHQKPALAILTGALFVALTISFPGKAAAPGQPSPGLPDLRVMHTSPDEIGLAARLPGVQADKIEVGDSVYTRFSGDDYGVGAQAGWPDLPVLRRYVEIPFGATVSVDIVQSRMEETSLAGMGLPDPVWPLQPSHCKCSDDPPAFTMDEIAYQTGAYFPAEPVAVTGELIVRGHRAVVVEVWPVAYNPVTGGLRFYSEVDFRLRLSGSDMALTRANADRYASPAFETRLSRELLNFNQGQPVHAFGSSTDVGYLIITADAYASSMAPFVALKQSQGFEVTHTPLSSIPGGATTTAIQAYIQTAYDTWPIPPSYVLLVGDTNTLPTWTGPVIGTSTDLYYGTMDGGDDWHPDIGRGRFPVRSPAQTTLMVNKYLAYDDFTGEEDWLKKAAFPATCDLYQIAEGTHNYVIDSYTLPKGYTGIFPNNPQPGGDKLYCITYGATQADVIASVNDGRAMVIYSGHGNYDGWELYSQSDIPAQTSYGMFPFVASHACLTGDFGETEVFGETWVLTANKGALAYWGSSTYSYWDEDDELERRMFDSLFAAEQSDIAGMTDFGLAGVEVVYPSSARYYWETYNVLGDPAAYLILEPRLPDLTLAADPNPVEICGAETVTTTITVGSVRGAGSTVSLSAQGVPAGVGHDFDPESFVLPGQSELSLTNDGSAAPGVYPIEITGAAPPVTQTTVVTLSVFTALPGQPTLQSPPDDATNQPLRPVFSWVSAQGGVYDLQIATDRHFDNLVVALTGLTVSSYTPPFDLAQNTVYDWRVRAANACGESVYSPTYRFLTQPAPGACSLGTVASDLLSEDFESGDPGWARNATGDTWALTNVRRYSGLYAFLSTDVNRVSDQWLVLPEISLPGGQLPLVLEFWAYQNLQNRTGGCYDGGILEISTNGGGTWTQIEAQSLSDPYDGPIAAGTQNPLAGAAAWCGKPQPWTKTLADLDSFAGEEVSIRFRLGTDNAIGYEGWYIDDVRLQACAPATTLTPDDDQQTLPGGGVTHLLTLTTLGVTDSFMLELTGGDWPATILGDNPITVTFGAPVTVPVRVDVPAIITTLTDVFTLTATSQNIPGIVLTAQAATHAAIAPAIGLSESQAGWGHTAEGVKYVFTVTNQGNYTDTFTLAVSGVWSASLPGGLSTGALSPGGSVTVTVTVDIPAGALPGDFDVTTLTVTSGWDGGVTGSVTARTAVWYQNYLPLVRR